MEGQYFLKAIASLVIAVAVMQSGCVGRGMGGSTADFIRTSCSATTYPALCYSSLSTHAAAIQQNPKRLASVALSVSLDTAVSTSAYMVKLSHAAGMTPREVGAMRDCVEELTNTVEQLRKSMAAMDHMKKGSDFDMIMSDVQTWVSAALTNEDYCMDGFAGKFMNGGVKTTVRGKIQNVAHMTSNALSLINTYVSLHAYHSKPS